MQQISHQIPVTRPFDNLMPPLGGYRTLQNTAWRYFVTKKAMKTRMEIQEKMNKEEMETLTRDVKETLAFEYTARNRRFNAVDLWNIHRRRKTISARRHYT